MPVASPRLGQRVDYYVDPHRTRRTLATTITGITADPAGVVMLTLTVAEPDPAGDFAVGDLIIRPARDHQIRPWRDPATITLPGYQATPRPGGGHDISVYTGANLTTPARTLVWNLTADLAAQVCAVLTDAARSGLQWDTPAQQRIYWADGGTVFTRHAADDPGHADPQPLVHHLRPQSLAEQIAAECRRAFAAGSQAR